MGKLNSAFPDSKKTDSIMGQPRGYELDSNLMEKKGWTSTPFQPQHSGFKKQPHGTNLIPNSNISLQSSQLNKIPEGLNTERKRGQDREGYNYPKTDEKGRPIPMAKSVQRLDGDGEQF
jgi:hypothetical protein